MKKYAGYLFVCLFSISAGVQAQTKKYFQEGIVYSRTSFPGHPLNDTLKKIDFEKGDHVAQYNLISDLKKYQQSIDGTNEQGIKDAFFASGMMILPVFSQTYLSKDKMLVMTTALGFNQKTGLNKTDRSGTIVVQDRNNETWGTIYFDLPAVRKAWQKYQVDAQQYSVQQTNETATIAGYPCRKIVYSFKGTSYSQPTNTVINLQPQKVTAWYTEEVDPSLNLQHPLYFDLDKAILRFEVEYDKNHKNKMLVEIIRLEPQSIDPANFELKEIAPSAVFEKEEMEAGMIMMKVMMSAVSLLSK